ncbi:hypothetical protein [Streptomyces sp. NPDC051994]|uniref:hypothetical protein n=1 Tax=unclassified Streptomyces TaxID=2593676 RepID=UPI00343116AC
MAEFPDGQGSAFSAQCARSDCEWKHDVSADPTTVHVALEDHAPETGHIFFSTVVASINAVDVPGVQEHRRKAISPAGQDPT